MKSPSFRAAATRLDGVEYEIAQEKAAALGRAAKRLDGALQALREADHDPRSLRSTTPDRAALIAAAAKALWYYVVQREACGFRDTDLLMQELQVPCEVQLRMGVRSRP